MKTIDLFIKNKTIQKIINDFKNDSSAVLVNNITDNHSYLLSIKLFQETNKFVFYVCSNNYKATKCYEQIVKIVGVENVNLYLKGEIVASEVDATSQEYKYERLMTITSLLTNSPKIIVTSVTAVLKEITSFDLLRKNIIEIKKGSQINRDQLISSLIEIGYKRTPTTSVVGYFSVRGEVIDVYPINENDPVRIEMFDDEVEKIKFYDKESQYSKKEIDLNSITIMPNTEIIFEEEKEDFINEINKINNYKINLEIEEIKNKNYSEKLLKYIKYYNTTTNSILDYCEDSIIMFERINELKENYETTINELYYYLETREELSGLKLTYFFDFEYLYRYNNLLFLSDGFDNEFNEYKVNNKYNVNGYSVVNYQNNLKSLFDEMKSGKEKYYFVFEKKEHLNLFKESIIANEIQKDKYEIIEDDNSLSFGFYGDYVVVAEDSIYKNINKINPKYRSVYNSTSLINSKDDLVKGDYVVHYDYGIGKYNGIKVLTTNNITNDYIAIQFANIELFIPVENITMLEKYKAEEGIIPKLTTIGTDEWKKKKQKIKEKLENLARDILLLQAYRDSKQGYKYEKDNELQIMFENDFEYEETKDQLDAINDIKKDMEEGKIIDRLVCGDVGYGKTEVAIRIAFKTVLNGKQVAYLAPTTILSRQHYLTFKERMEKYGVNVALINRMITAKEKTRIIKELKNGTIDVVVGTHALLNDAIGYKDMGLLIIDEEQRFGVSHKEKIKQYKNNINVLTLSATPIPRTLQMSLVGARQMSLMETAPINRYPVQTYVLEKNETIIREAIYNEMGRGGQVFYLHNKVFDIYNVYDKLKKLVPEANIVVAHGQMDKKELENSVQDFIDHKYDVLLCTTIIETGIDIPNTNTLIVENSERLGLAQMYQIRGRVGRTSRVSYAYFMYDSEVLLTQEGRLRLKSLKEFTALGSGYKIALRDLAIRGAGDILGKEQSGYIDIIGMDLYMKMLNDSLNQIQEAENEEQREIISNVKISKHIDDNYVSDDDIKIYIHKAINKIETKEDRDNLIDELIDRFGRLTKDIKTYIDKCYLDSLILKHNIEEIYENDFKVKIVFSLDSSKDIPGTKMMDIVYKQGEDFSLEYKNKKYIVYITKVINNKSWVTKACEFFESLT